MTSTQLPSDVFPQTPTVQVKIDRRSDDGNLGGGVGGLKFQVCSYSGTKIIPEVQMVWRTDYLIITNVQKCRLLALLIRGFILIRIGGENVRWERGIAGKEAAVAFLIWYSSAESDYSPRNLSQVGRLQYDISEITIPNFRVKPKCWVTKLIIRTPLQSEIDIY